MLSENKIKELAFNWSDETTYFFKEHELFDFVFLLNRELQKLRESNCLAEIVSIIRKDFDRANSVLLHEDQEPLMLLNIKEK